MYGGITGIELWLSWICRFEGCLCLKPMDQLNQIHVNWEDQFVEFWFLIEESGVVSWWPRQIDILQCRVWDFETILCGGQMTTQISLFWLTMNPFGFFPHVTGLSLLATISIRDRNFLFWGILVEFCLCLLDWLPASQFSAVLVCSTLPQTLL